MTMILELPAELEARLKADAQARGIAPETVVIETVSARYKEPDETPERSARLQEARGFLKRATGEHGFGVEGFLAEKRADVARDEAKS